MKIESVEFDYPIELIDGKNTSELRLKKSGNNKILQYRTWSSKPGKHFWNNRTWSYVWTDVPVVETFKKPKKEKPAVKKDACIK